MLFRYLIYFSAGLQEMMHAINQNRHSQLHESEVHHFNILMKLRYAENLESESFISELLSFRPV